MVVSVISKKLKRTNFVPNHYRATSIKVFAKYFFPALKWHKIEAEMIVFQRGIFIAHIFSLAASPASIGNDDDDDDDKDFRNFMDFENNATTASTLSKNMILIFALLLRND